MERWWQQGLKQMTLCIHHINAMRLVKPLQFEAKLSQLSLAIISRNDEEDEAINHTSITTVIEKFLRINSRRTSAMKAYYGVIL